MMFLTSPRTSFPKDDETSSQLEAIGHTLRTKAGGIGIGSLSALAAGAAAASVVGTGGLSLIPLTVGAAAGIGGGILGQKAQEAIQGEELSNRLAQEQAKIEEEHPYTTLGTDIIASSLLSGGALKPSNLLNAGKLLIGRDALDAVGKSIGKRALGELAFQSAVTPAINTGVGYGLTGQLPTAKDLAAQAIGGALFSGQNALGRRFMPHGEAVSTST
jgi:hypothetical protein